MLSALCETVCAYWLADFLGALYHVATDRGFNTPKKVADFQRHHLHPETVTFDLQPMLAGVPLCGLGIWVGSPFLIALGVFLSVAQVPHYFTHHPAPRWFRRLQTWGVVITPSLHAQHHQGDFGRDFSVTNGWANGLVNRLVAAVPVIDDSRPLVQWIRELQLSPDDLKARAFLVRHEAAADLGTIASAMPSEASHLAADGVSLKLSRVTVTPKTRLQSEVRFDFE